MHFGEHRVLGFIPLGPAHPGAFVNDARIAAGVMEPPPIPASCNSSYPSKVSFPLGRFSVQIISFLTFWLQQLNALENIPPWGNTITVCAARRAQCRPPKGTDIDTLHSQNPIETHHRGCGTMYTGVSSYGTPAGFGILYILGRKQPWSS